jgi:hypothetical protein
VGEAILNFARLTIARFVVRDWGLALLSERMQLRVYAALSTTDQAAFAPFLISRLITVRGVNHQRVRFTTLIGSV